MTDDGRGKPRPGGRASGASPLDLSALRIRSASVAEGLSARLERMIEEGVLPPGARLPAERELAAQLGVSRASVREALSELELKGLVDRRPGRGTLVTGGGERPPSMLGRWSPQERRLNEVMDMRLTLEPAIAARAAGRATERDLRRLSETLGQMGAEPDLEAFHALDVEFHRQIARATHNELLVELIEQAVGLMAPSRASEVRSAARRRASLEAHREILDAIAASDSAEAAAAMTRHLEAVKRMASEVVGA